MKKLEWGTLEQKKILNTKLLDKTNIRKFVGQDELDILDSAIVLYLKEAPSKKNMGSLIFKSGKSEDGIVHISIEIPRYFYILDEEFVAYDKYVIKFKENEPYSASIFLDRVDPIKISTTATSAKITLDSTNLYVKQNDDGTLEYMKFGGLRRIKINKKDKEEIRKIKPSKVEISEIKQKTF